MKFLGVDPKRRRDVKHHYISAFSTKQVVVMSQALEVDPKWIRGKLYWGDGREDVM